MFLLNMLVVGLVETGPNVFKLELLNDCGDIVEYTMFKEIDHGIRPY
jgi:hypothetical protein